MDFKFKNKLASLNNSKIREEIINNAVKQRTDQFRKYLNETQINNVVQGLINNCKDDININIHEHTFNVLMQQYETDCKPMIYKKLEEQINLECRTKYENELKLKVEKECRNKYENELKLKVEKECRNKYENELKIKVEKECRNKYENELKIKVEKESTNKYENELKIKVEKEFTVVNNEQNLKKTQLTTKNVPQFSNAMLKGFISNSLNNSKKKI
jgi:hypothetical protein